MLNRTELRRRLHDMVDSLFEGTPDDWIENGVYPMLRITMRSTTADAADDAFTLVVGLDRADQF